MEYVSFVNPGFHTATSGGLGKRSMLLFREEYYKPDSEEAKGLAEVIIAKHRKGSVGSFRLSFRGETLTFAEPPLPSDTF